MCGIPKENVLDVWSIAEPHLLRAVQRSNGAHNIEDIKKKCLSGDFILWMANNLGAAVILAVSDYPKGKQCDIVMMGGDGFNSWFAELADIEDWIKRIGCKRITLTGRKGWLRVLPDYELQTITMVKTL